MVLALNLCCVPPLVAAGAPQGLCPPHYGNPRTRVGAIPQVVVSSVRSPPESGWWGHIFRIIPRFNHLWIAAGLHTSVALA